MNRLACGLPLATATLSTQTFTGAAEETADMVVTQDPNGSWRRVMCVKRRGAPYDGNRFDLSTFTNVTMKLEPGTAYDCCRRTAA